MNKNEKNMENGRRKRWKRTKKIMGKKNEKEKDGEKNEEAKEKEKGK